MIVFSTNTVCWHYFSKRKNIFLKKYLNVLYIYRGTYRILHPLRRALHFLQLITKSCVGALVINYSCRTNAFIVIN